MDSDNQLSEDEEAKMYAMLYYVDSTTVKCADKQKTSAITQDARTKTNHQEVDTIVSNVQRPKTPPSFNEKTVNDSQNEQQRQDETPTRHSNVESFIQTFESSESNNQTSANTDQSKNLSNDRARRKVTHSKRYWASGESYGNGSTMYIRVHTNNPLRKSSNKLDKTIITLLNTRASGKRKSSEGSTLPDDNNANSTSNTNVDSNKNKATPAKQSKPTFATPTNVSPRKGGKSSKTVNYIRISERRNNNSKTLISSKKFDKQQTRHTPLTQKLLDKFNAGVKRIKQGHALKNSESIVIDSSDDDSIIEVELPDPRHTTIELDSSDESQTENKDQDVDVSQNVESSVPTSVAQSNTHELRRTATSPVPSIVSSTSDDFIQADCSSLNITSGINSGPVFNFQLHGSDFCDTQLDATTCDTSTPMINKSASASNDATKKQQVFVTSTTRLLDIDTETNLYQVTDNSYDSPQNFATPISKSKKKNGGKSKSYSVPVESYVLPSADIFESESSDIPESVVEVPITPVVTKKKRRKSSSKEDPVDSTTDDVYIVDLHYTPPDNDTLVMANVVGMDESNPINEEFNLRKSFEATDDATVQKKQNKNSRRRKSEDFENDMNKYYNTIYDQNFDHNKIRSQMPKDKSLWKIDPADRGKTRKSPIKCGHCNKSGHRTETCYRKPQVCSMCGGVGHRDTRCPNKICLNCGNSNNTFSVDCNNCKSWKNIYCGTCREHGHPSTRCPDIWRRYHLTIKNEVPLVECKKRKAKSLLFCSGCAKRGHIINDCSNYIKFSNFKPASPYIFHYTPVYTPDAVRNPSSVEIIQIEDECTSKSKGKDCDIRPKPPSKETDTKTKYQVYETENKIKTQVRDTESKAKNQVRENDKAKVQTREPDNRTKNQLKESGRPKTPSKELNNKTKNQNKESDNKTKTQSTTPPPPPTDADNVVSSSDSPPKHLMITVFSNKSSDKNVRDVRVIENIGTSSPRSSKKNDSKSGVANTDVNNQIQEHQERVDSSKNGIKDISKPSDAAKGNKNNVVSKIKQLDNNETSLILLTNPQGQILMSQAGSEFLNKLVQTYNVMIDFNSHSDGATLTLSGNVNKHEDVQGDVKLYLNLGDKVLDFVPRHFIPKERCKALGKLRLEMKLLNSDLGNPQTIFRKNEFLKACIKKRRLISQPQKKEFKNLCKEINKGHRLLNMILIGQARLSEGGAYTKLDNMLKYLEAEKFSAMSDQIRDEVGELYSTIFSSNPRHDYPELLDKYYKMDANKLKSFNTVQSLLSKNKKSMTQEELITVIRKTRDEFDNFKDSPAVFEDKRYINSLKSLIDMESNMVNKKISKKGIVRIRDTVFQYAKYLKVCKKKIRYCNKI